MAIFGKQNTDDQIEQEARRFLMHGELNIRHLDVRVRDSELTLTGIAPSYEAKRAAEDAAQGIPGVSNVHNHIQVEPAKEE